MQLRYLRLAAFYSLMRGFSARARRRRMKSFAQLMGIQPGSRVLDLGGHPAIWEHVAIPLDITVLNLPGEVARSEGSHHTFRYVEGDACAVTGFQSRAFDLVFSNSVIEHVGPEDRQEAFASQVRRLGCGYWVQTPSKWFPVEAHTGMPFYWFYPQRVRDLLIRGWRKKLPSWTSMVEGTRVLSRGRLAQLFPEASIKVEYSAVLPKSYVAYSVPDPAAAGQMPGTRRTTPPASLG